MYSTTDGWFSSRSASRSITTYAIGYVIRHPSQWLLPASVTDWLTTEYITMVHQQWPPSYTQTPTDWPMRRTDWCDGLTDATDWLMTEYIKMVHQQWPPSYTETPTDWLMRLTDWLQNISQWSTNSGHHRTLKHRRTDRCDGLTDVTDWLMWRTDWCDWRTDDRIY